MCEKPLGLRYWVHDRHLRVHEACRPWHEVKWPFRDVQKALRQRVELEQRSADKQRLRKLEAKLREAEQRWPRGAVETVQMVRERVRPILSR